MSSQAVAEPRAKAWLLFRSGPLAGTRFPMPDGTIRLGRALDNDVVIDGPDSGMVSLNHLEISRTAGSCRIRDLNSTNGTWLNGERITETEVALPTVLQLGSQGPEFELMLEEAMAGELDRTIEIRPSAVAQFPAANISTAAPDEKLLSSAVIRARRLRARGVNGQTITIMRGVVEQALRRSRRRSRIIGYSLLAALLTVSALAAWQISVLKREKRVFDAQIQQLEAQLQKATQGSDVDRIVSQLDDYENQVESLQRTLLYRLGVARQEGDFVIRELHSLMTEFGAEVYSIPPDFIERVNHYIEQDRGPERPVIARALTQTGEQLRIIRGILQEEQLPADLAYIPLVESALRPGQVSAAGAVGPWQFTEATAKQYGLHIDDQIDERQDLLKSTRASCKYLRDLILDFGAGTSVMLALAAYDSGPLKVKQAVAKTVRDPIKQRNFWYLYRTKALPLETREYVPKVLAAILIGRDPSHFGF
jgi:pSer/pThr/pTyr-binding forkhead associated (FHA) protein